MPALCLKRAGMRLEQFRDVDGFIEVNIMYFVISLQGAEIFMIRRDLNVRTAGKTRWDTGSLGGWSGNDVVDRDETSWTGASTK